MSVEFFKQCQAVGKDRHDSIHNRTFHKYCTVLISSLMDGTLSISGASSKSSFNSLNVNILTTFLPFLAYGRSNHLSHNTNQPLTHRFFEREQELFFVPVLPFHISQRKPVETQVNCIQFLNFLQINQIYRFSDLTTKNGAKTHSKKSCKS